MAKNEIDLIKLIKYILKRIWLPIICAIIGAGAMYYYTQYMIPDTYTATASMYVLNGNPNVVNYQYTNVADLSASEQLVDIYSVVIRSNKVMSAVSERLGEEVTPGVILRSLHISPVEKTSIMKISCTTGDPELSMDICNAVADIAPAEIVRVVSAGNVEVIDYAILPAGPNDHGTMKKAMMGGMAGLVLGAAILVVLFLANRKVTSGDELVENYGHPLLASIPKHDVGKKENAYYLLGPGTPSAITSAYAKLRLNVNFAIHGKSKIVVVSSSIPQETKSTVAANLAIAFANDGKKVLLIDGDMRKPTISGMFGLEESEGGLSNILVPENGKEGKIWKDVRPNLDIVTAGMTPPNPTELLGSPEMEEFMKKSEAEYDIVILDTPPINVVNDSLIPSAFNVGMLFVTRCNYSDHREIRKALNAADYTKMNILGMVMTCADKMADGYYNNKYYKKYYSGYDKANIHSKK